MKNKIIALLFFATITTGYSQTKVGQLAPCLDLEGNAVAGCKLVTDLGGNWVEVVYSKTNCVNGDLQLEYVDHSGSVLHIETIGGMCTDPTSTCHSSCNGNLSLIHNAVGGTIDFMIVDASTNKLIFDFSNFNYLGNDIATSVDVSINFEFSGTPMVISDGLTSTGFEIPNLLHTYPDNACHIVTISFATDNGLYFEMQYAINISDSGVDNIDAGASIPGISFDATTCEVTFTGFENQGDAELTTFSADGTVLHNYGFDGALTATDSYSLDGAGVAIDTPIVLQTYTEEAAGCAISERRTIQSFALICE